MNKLVTVFCFLLALSPFALAQDKGKSADKMAAPAAEKSATAKKEPSEKQKAQQERMTDCNGKASDKKGDDRKKFMSSCLKGEAPGASDKQKAQQEKMKSCNKDAGEKNMKGDARKQFMSSCLKG